MKTFVLALAAAAALSVATPALAYDGAPRGVAIEKVALQTQDFSSHNRYWRHHHRHHRYFVRCWRHCHRHFG